MLRTEEGWDVSIKGSNEYLNLAPLMKNLPTLRAQTRIPRVRELTLWILANQSACYFPRATNHANRWHTDMSRCPTGPPAPIKSHNNWNNCHLKDCCSPNTQLTLSSEWRISLRGFLQHISSVCKLRWVSTGFHAAAILALLLFVYHFAASFGAKRVIIIMLGLEQPPIDRNEVSQQERRNKAEEQSCEFKEKSECI